MSQKFRRGNRWVSVEEAKKIDLGLTEEVNQEQAETTEQPEEVTEEVNQEQPVAGVKKTKKKTK